VLIGWQYFVGLPQMEKQRQEQAQQQAAKTGAGQPGQAAQPPIAAPGAAPGAAQAPGQVPGAVPGQTAAPGATTTVTREAALKASPRVAIDTGSIQGSIDLKGGRIDDISLVKFRETVDPKSPPIVLLSPSGSPEPFYAEFGWTGTAGANVKLPTSDTVWKQAGSGALAVGHPVTLTYDNGEGLEFRRIIPFHHQGRGSEQERQPGHLVSLCADLAPRHAEDARLLHPS
jgi:YidC/Oxa1 family membrane protein insertase